MVKVGFICEGDTERKIIESVAFQQTLTSLGLICIKPIEDADGNGNLLPHNIEPIREKLFAAGANIIFVMTDLDKDANILVTKQRISELPNQIIIIAVKAVEAWFLADSVLLSGLMSSDIHIDYPENEEQPFETIRQLFLSKTGRGVGTKHILATRFIKYGFTIEKAAQHPNCPSAHYFLTKLQTLASAN
ncbi:hypothetical protein BH09BAC4_BH09BAC4_27540 [soil metagenome]